MRTNTRIVLTRFMSNGHEEFRVTEVVGSLTPSVNTYITAAEVQALIDDRSNTIVIRARKD